MAQPLLIEFIELQARGIADVQDALTQLTKKSADAKQANQDLLDSLNDPANARAAKQYLQLSRQMEATKKLEQDRLGLLRQQQSIESRINATKSGRYGDSLTSQLQMQRLDMKAREAERRIAMRPEFVNQRRDLADRQRMEQQRAERLLRTETLLARQRDLKSGRYSKGLEDRVDLARMERGVNDQEKKAQEANPKFQAFKKEQADLLRAEQQRTAELKAREQIQARTDDVQSGRYTQRLKTNQELEQLERKAKQVERRAELGFKYGRLGGLVYGAERLAQSALGQGVRGAVGGMGMLGGGLMGMGIAGLSGTVEGNRIMNETTLIMREFANAAKPLFDLTITGLSSFRKVMQSLTPETQKVLMGFMAIGGAGMLLRMSGLGGLAMSAGGMALRGGMGLMGMAGAQFGGQVAGSAASRLLGGAGGSVAAGATGAAGSRLLGGAAGGGAAAGGLGSLARMGGYGLLAAGVIAGVTTGLSSPTGRVDMMKSLGMGDKTASWTAASMSAINPVAMVNDAFHGRMPGRDLVKGMAGSISRGLGYEPPSWAKMNEGSESSKKKGEKSKVTVADAGFAELGSGYERLADAFALIGASKEDTKQDGLIGTMQELIESIAQLITGEKATDSGNVIKLQRGRN